MLNALKTLLLALLSQLPLFAAAFTWSQDVIQNPIIAAFLALIYELFVLLVAFGQEVWAELKPQAVKASADWAKTAFRNTFSRFRRRYNEQIYYDHRFFNTSGLRTRGGAIVELNQVFVSLRVAHSDLQQARKNPVQFRELEGNQPIWRFLNQLEKLPVNALAIIGAPGSGKTTLLQHVALIFAANRQRQYRLRGYTPLLLFLREHVQTIVEEKLDLASLAQAHFSDQKRYPTLKPPPEWFARQLEGGRCIVLLDGLDEVATVEQRQIVARWVDQQTSTYHRCCFVLTARPGGYKDAPLSKAHMLEVQPFDREQVKNFVHNWYLATKMALSDKRDAGIRQDASREADDLLRRLRTRPVLQELAVNPLLLTMMALVHNHRGVLPGSRVELYNEICDVFLEHWQRAKNLHDALNAAQKRTALQPLAAYMMQQPKDDDNNRRTISEKKALEIMTPHLQRTDLSDEQIANFLPSMQKSSLLLEAEIGQWSFAHLTFQEYLCAAHWQQDGNPPTSWRCLVRDSWWHETLRLYAAQADATRLVVACLTLNTLESLTLAAELNDESRHMDTSVRNILHTRLRENLEAQDPKLRQRAAEVYLNRRLKKPYSVLDEKTSIDNSFITCAEYQLFLDEKRVENKYHQPDHWGSFTFPTDQAEKPITGVCFEDAQAFCEWLSDRTGHCYRLPTQEEISLLPLDNMSFTLATWGSEGVLHFLKSESEETIEDELQQIVSTVLPLPKNLVQGKNFTIAQDKNLVKKLVVGFAQELSLDFDFATDLVKYLDLARNFESSQHFDESPAISFVLALGHDLIRNFTQNLSFILHPIRELIENLTQSIQFTEHLTENIKEKELRNGD